VDNVADNIYSKVDTEIANILTDIGPTSATGGSATSGTVMAKLNKLISDVASAIANTTTNNTGNKTGILSQKLSYLISLLENSTYGLNALTTAIGKIPTTSTRGSYGIGNYIESIGGGSTKAYTYPVWIIPGMNIRSSGTVTAKIGNSPELYMNYTYTGSGSYATSLSGPYLVAKNTSINCV
jgi:hypothetical protein